MLISNKALILNTIKFGETSLIVKAYTQHDGLQSFLFQGVRAKGKSNQTAIFQPLNLLQLHYLKKYNQELIKVRNLQLLKSPFMSHLNANTYSILFFVNDLLSQTLKFDQADEDLFAFLESQLVYLSNTTAPAANYPCYLMIQLSAYLGIAPSADENGKYFDYQNGCFVTEANEHTILIDHALSFKKLMLEQDVDKLDQLALNGQKRMKIIEALNLFYKQQLAHFKGLKSLEVLQQLLYSNQLSL